MQKFEIKLDIVRFDAADVIATSGHDTPEVAIIGLIYEEEQRNLDRSVEA